MTEFSTKEEPPRAFDPREGERYDHEWGYRDTQFEFCDPDTVRITGDRYPLSGKPLPDFLPFAREVFGLDLGQDSYETPREDIPVPDSKLPGPVHEKLKDLLSPRQVTTEDRLRLIHSHGQLSVNEIYAMLFEDGQPMGRSVDAVVYPENRDDARGIVQFASEHDLCLIPYGGGTNVTGAVSPPDGETRPVLSVDMRRMDRVREIDGENYQAWVEAGITGKALEKTLNDAGFTTGHTPDSIELSTLGGWIATKASGMKQNRYGNIEDLVLEVTLVAPDGTLNRRVVAPRESTGPESNRLVFGSEGCLGLITDARLKIYDAPETKKYGSLVFSSFDRGVQFLRELTHRGQLPASIRLVNNLEFRLGRALKPKSGWLQARKDQLKKWYLENYKGYDPEQTAACIILMEGTDKEVRRLRNDVFERAKKYGGLDGGSEAGRRGYMATFAIAYIRDFLNRLGVIGETMETSTWWDRVSEVTDAARRRLETRCEEHDVSGSPYLSYRVTQCYQTGVCIYFTMGFYGRDLDNPVETYNRIEKDVRQAILEAGGSLSHHHGVGKIRQEFMTRDEDIACERRILQRTKQTLDSENIFGARNNVFVAGD